MYHVPGQAMLGTVEEVDRSNTQGFRGLQGNPLSPSDITRERALSDESAVVLPERFERSTSPLPRECSTPELRQH
jgi:hypothetical protein